MAIPPKVIPAQPAPADALAGLDAGADVVSIADISRTKGSAGADIRC